jgi:nicotinate-nucleotide pyrophosphorylase (carboxylating)
VRRATRSSASDRKPDALGDVVRDVSTSENLDLVSLVEGFLAEDIGRGDRTTDATVPADARGRARIEAREAAVVAGLEAARTCFEVLAPGDIRWSPEVADGDRVGPGDVLVRIEGPLRAILTAERTALNLLQRLSGTATMTRRFVDEVAGTSVRIVDTRKTSPGLRGLEKYAVRVGGGTNHRSGLDDGILIKDNHIAASGGVTEAVTRAKRAAPHGLRVEVEVQNLDELDAALAAGADAILLDNMSPELIREAVARAGGKALLEASGGIKLDNLKDYAQTGVDLISVGALTHSAKAIDLSLEVEA